MISGSIFEGAERISRETSSSMANYERCSLTVPEVGTSVPNSLSALQALGEGHTIGGDPTALRFHPVQRIAGGRRLLRGRFSRAREARGDDLRPAGRRFGRSGTAPRPEGVSHFNPDVCPTQVNVLAVELNPPHIVRSGDRTELRMTVSYRLRS